MTDSKQFEQMKQFVMRGVSAQRAVDKIIKEHEAQKETKPDVIIKKEIE